MSVILVGSVKEWFVGFLDKFVVSVMKMSVILVGSVKEWFVGFLDKFVVSLMKMSVILVGFLDKFVRSVMKIFALLVGSVILVGFLDKFVLSVSRTSLVVALLEGHPNIGCMHTEVLHIILPSWYALAVDVRIDDFQTSFFFSMHKIDSEITIWRYGHN